MAKLCKICSSRFERGGECQICAENKFVADRIDANTHAINASKRLLETEFLVLDTETTGLDSDAEIIEIAILDCAGNTLFESYVKPTQPCSPDAEKIHKITPKILANAPTWADIHEQVFNMLNSRTVAIYNAEFDIRIIEQTCKKYALTAPRYNAFCIMNAYSKFYGELNDSFKNWRWHKLTSAARDLNCYEPAAHRAAADCKMALGVLRGIARG